ncbi:hypothetical protein Bca52824_011736 [Brassica carinata]|uniref:RNase H type-1 domain-containing protein n=1 Tax=Brassica carinata TaxID=52824 RepID=A0A8X7VXL8_BRACI|nr:hypothetical protein Bca52824_011736 [Brassica carinata]
MVRHIPWLLWNVWRNRNSIWYSETQESPDFWVSNAEEEASLWFEVKEQATLTERQNSNPPDKERWCPPMQGTVKCNVHVNWRNKTLQCGGAWMARDHTGNVLFHGCDAFTPSISRLAAELRGIIWVLQSARDLHFHTVSIASDHVETIEAISTPASWPRFRFLLELIAGFCSLFSYVAFEVEGVCANTIARDIAKSVMKDGQFQSYLALGGLAWLHQRIAAEASGQD